MRYRTAIDGYQAGVHIDQSTDQTYEHNPVSASRESIDTVGQRNSDNQLSLRKDTITGSITNGLYTGGIHLYNGWPSGGWYGRRILRPGVPGLDLNGLVTLLLAKTNPGRTGQNLPAFIGELKDLPGMLRHAGRLLQRLRNPRRFIPSSGLSAAQEAASAYLAYQFGWAPLVNDLGKLATFVDSVANRQKELDRLHSKGGLKRRLTLDTFDSMESEVDIIDYRPGLNLAPIINYKVHRNIWGTIRWLPTNVPQSQNISAARAFYGLNVFGIIEAAWELLPWSWLIDYFANIGTFIQANNNSIPAKPSGVNIMIDTAYGRSHDLVVHDAGSGFSTSPGLYATRLKERIPILDPHPGLTFSLPFLSDRQMAILSSLAIVKLKR